MLQKELKIPRKNKPSTTSERRAYTDEFRRDAVAMLLDGHSAASIAERLGISFFTDGRRSKLSRPDRLVSFSMAVLPNSNPNYGGLNANAPCNESAARIKSPIGGHGKAA